MKFFRLFPIILLLCAQLAGASSTSDLVQALRSNDYAARFAALNALESIIARASAPDADAAHRAALERELLGHVASAALSDLSRAHLIRLLPPIASEASLQQMLQLVLDVKTSRMLGNDATGLIAVLVESAPPETLTKSLLVASAPARELLWTAISLRADARLAKPLVKLLRQKKLPLDDLAIQTLGAMGGRDVASYLMSQWKPADGSRRAILAKAILHTGVASASELKELCQQSEGAEIRVAALRQWALKNERASLAFLQTQIEAGAPDLTALLAVQLDSGGRVSWQGITQKGSTLSEAALITVLQSIREQQRRELEPWVLQRLPGAGEPVELAAIRCLAVVGGSQSTDALLERVKTGSGKVSAAALNSLEVLKDDSLDGRLKEIISDPAHPQFLVAYELVARRNSPGSTGYFNQLFAERSPAGKELTAGLRGMESLGNIESVKILLARLQAEQNPAAVRAIQISIKRVVLRLEQPDRIWAEAFAPVLSQSAGAVVQARILPLLDAVSTPEALALCLERIRGEDATLARAAEQALIRWRSIDVCGYWLAVINDPSKSDAARDQALRYVDQTLRSDVQAAIPLQVARKAAKLFLATENKALQDSLLLLVSKMGNRWKAAFHQEVSPQLQRLPGYREQVEALIKR